MQRSVARKSFRYWSRLSAAERSQGGVYLLHFDPPFHHALHYLGFAENLRERIAQHIRGTSRVGIVECAIKNGSKIRVVCVWPGASRRDERELKGLRNEKRKGSLRQMCPRCLKLVEAKA